MFKSCFDRNGNFNNEKFNDLAIRFKSVIFTYVNKYALSEDDMDELYQAGLIGLYKSVLKYQENGRYTFEFTAKMNIKNTIRAYLLTTSRKRHPIKHPAFSLALFGPIPKISAKQDSWHPNSLDNQEQDPLEIVICQENVHRIKIMLKTCLSDNERKVLCMRMAGYKQRHIAKRLNFHPKAVDNALQRARRKLSYCICNEQQ